MRSYIETPKWENNSNTFTFISNFHSSLEAMKERKERKMCNIISNNIKLYDY